MPLWLAMASSTMSGELIVSVRILGQIMAGKGKSGGKEWRGGS